MSPMRPFQYLKTLLALARKLNAGDPLTAEEQRIYDEAEAGSRVDGRDLVRTGLHLRVAQLWLAVMTGAAWVHREASARAQRALDRARTPQARNMRRVERAN